MEWLSQCHVRKRLGSSLGLIEVVVNLLIFYLVTPELLYTITIINGKLSESLQNLNCFRLFHHCILDIIKQISNKDRFSLIFYPVTKSPSFTVLNSHSNEIVNICEKRILIIKHMLCTVTVKHRVDCRTDHLVFSPF